MNTFKVAKNIFAIIMVLLLGINLYFFFVNKDESNNYEAVAQENQQLKSDINQLEYEVENFSNTAREQYYEDLVSQASTFVDLAFIVKQEGYEKRKNKASSVMNDALKERFYPSETNYQDQVQTEIKEPKFYVEKLEKGQDKIDVLIETQHKMTNLNTNQSNETKLFVRVTFENINDKWIATKLEDIISNTKNLSEDENKE